VASLNRPGGGSNKRGAAVTAREPRLPTIFGKFFQAEIGNQSRPGGKYIDAGVVARTSAEGITLLIGSSTLSPITESRASAYG
jgi:hypothetical protein